MISIKKIGFLVCMLTIVAGFVNLGAGNQAQVRKVSKQIEKDEKKVEKLEKKLKKAKPSNWDSIKEQLESARSYLWKHRKELIALTVATAIAVAAYAGSRGNSEYQPPLEQAHSRLDVLTSGARDFQEESEKLFRG